MSIEISVVHRLGNLFSQLENNSIHVLNNIAANKTGMWSCIQWWIFRKKCELSTATATAAYSHNSHLALEVLFVVAVAALPIFKKITIKIGCTSDSGCIVFKDLAHTNMQ